MSNKEGLLKQQSLVVKESKELALDTAREAECRLGKREQTLEEEQHAVETLLEEQIRINARMCRRLSAHDTTLARRKMQILCSSGLLPGHYLVTQCCMRLFRQSQDIFVERGTGQEPGIHMLQHMVQGDQVHQANKKHQQPGQHVDATFACFYSEAGATCAPYNKPVANRE